MTDSSSWLENWHSNGVTVGSAELLYYRSKVAAFSRHNRLHPPKSQAGILLSKHKGRGMEFDEVRHYQAGDDVRAIDWRVTARTGTPHTKLFREERERPIMFVVDLDYSQHFGSGLLLKSVQACHLAAALSWQAVARGDRVGAIIGRPGRHLESRPQARQQGVMRVIHSLVELQHESVTDWQQQAPAQPDLLNDLLNRARQVARPGTIIYLVSDWLAADEDTFNLCQALQRHCQVYPMQLFDPLERELPANLQAYNLTLTDGHQRLALPAWSNAERTAYQHAAQQRQLELIARFKRANLQLREVDAARALEEQWPEVMA